MHRPYRLVPGDRIGIVAPSSPVEADLLETGVSALKARGYQPVVGRHVLATVAGNDYLAGTDEQRSEDLHEMFADERIAAIFCARGGYGAMRLFPYLDMALIGARPCIFVGYSDITSLHLAMVQQGAMISFHGPNVTALSRLNEPAAGCFWKLLEQPEPYGVLPADPQTLTTVVPGIAEGELAGGNLCLLAHACGSRFTPDFRDKIVLIEDINEAIYRADRDLSQLHNAGLLEQAAGFVVGTITRWRSQESDPPCNSIEALWHDRLAAYGKPLLTGFPFGHEPNPLTLPLGVGARLDAGAKTLALLEPAVS